MEIILRGREYRRDNVRVALNLMECYKEPNRIEFIVVEQFWGSGGKTNKILRGFYTDKEIAKREYRRMLYNLERTLPIREVENAMY